MKKLIILAAILLAGCNEPGGDKTAYEVIRYVGHIPVERWVCDDVSSRSARGEVRIYYKGYFKDLGDNVKVRKLDNYTGSEMYEELVRVQENSSL